MKRIFIDLGSHVGESVKFFRKHHPQGNEFEIYCFEPLPANIEKLKAMNPVWNINIIEAAATNYTGKMRLFTGMSESGSLYSEKRTGGLDGKNAIKVDTIDFQMWLVSNINPNDYIIIKMNVEGSEYDIIPDFEDLMHNVDKWYIQWHYAKIKLPKHKHDEIKAMIPKDKLFPWGAMFGDAFVDEFKASL